MLASSDISSDICYCIKFRFTLLPGLISLIEQIRYPICTPNPTNLISHSQVNARDSTVAVEYLVVWKRYLESVYTTQRSDCHLFE
ncbi:hypothetical protein EMCRGX_G033486 [Ephydatia muelleri]